MIACLPFASCNKTEETKPQTTQQNNNTTTPKIEGTWKISEYDGMAMTAPAAGSLKFTSSNTTADIDITFDGSAHSTETATYVLSANDTKIHFTKTGGTFTVLSGGNTWSIDTLNDNMLRMHSKFGLIIKATK